MVYFLFLVVVRFLVAFICLFGFFENYFYIFIAVTSVESGLEKGCFDGLAHAQP